MKGQVLRFLGLWLIVDAIVSLWQFRKQRLPPEQAIRVARLAIGLGLSRSSRRGVD